jgi:hypothetical protein
MKSLILMRRKIMIGTGRKIPRNKETATLMIAIKCLLNPTIPTRISKKTVKRTFIPKKNQIFTQNIIIRRTTLGPLRH